LLCILHCFYLIRFHLNYVKLDASLLGEITCMYALTEFKETVTGWRVHKGRLLLAQYWVIIIFLPLLTVLISISSGIPNHTASIQVNLLLGFGSTECLTTHVQETSLDYIWIFIVKLQNLCFFWRISSKVKHSVLGVDNFNYISFWEFQKILFSFNKTFNFNEQLNWFSSWSALFPFPLKFIAWYIL
jgi:hypothetical protein